MHLQAIRTVLCARNCCLLTRIVTSVRISLLRSRFRLSRTSLAWRVNWMQLSAAQAIFSRSVRKHSEHEWCKLTEQRAKFRKVEYYSNITGIFKAYISCWKLQEQRQCCCPLLFLGRYVKTSIKNIALIKLCIKKLSMCTSSAFPPTKEHKRRRYGEWQPQSPFTFIATFFFLI